MPIFALKSMRPTAPIPREHRIHTSILAGIEKRCLIWIAHRLPKSIRPDHLTALGALAMLGAGVAFAIAPGRPLAFLAVVLFLALNWFGDSLDGTVARVRHQERPRYGFYVDYVLDVVGILWLFAGLVAGGFMTPWSARRSSSPTTCSTSRSRSPPYCRTFRISYWKMGPTELRILLAAGTPQPCSRSTWHFFGGRYLLFDVGGVVAIAALLATFVVSAISNTRLRINGSRCRRQRRCRRLRSN